MTTEELAALARAQPNPFAGAVLRNGFEPPQADVPEIHAEQRRKLRALVEEVRQSGQLALQVVTGEPGDGKTHLLATLRAEAEGSWGTTGAERVMVPIDPLRDADAPFVHVLQGLVRGLRRPLGRQPPAPDSLATPLDRILWGILQRAVQQSPDPACSAVAALFGPYPSAAAIVLQDKWAQLEAALVDAPPPEADPQVWAALCRFPRLPGLVVRWLGGFALPEEELRPLGLAHPLDTEERAFGALSTLLRLSQVPIVLGFDQLEGVARLGEGAVERFLQALADHLYTAGGRAAVLLFCQADVWAGFSARLQTQVRDRLLEQAPLHLGALEPALGEKLIARRLEAMWATLGQKPPHATFPYPPGYVRETLAKEGLKGPRRILAFFAARGFASAPGAPPLHVPSPAEIALSAYERLRSDAPTDRAPDEDAKVARSVLLTLLSKARTVGDTAIVAARTSGHGLEVKAARGGRERRAYVEASNSRHGMAAKAVARRLQAALEAHDRVLLVRDARIPLPPMAFGMVEALGERAAIVSVDEESGRAFSGIEGLLNGAESQDIEVPREVALQVVVERIAPSLSALQRLLDAVTGPGEEPKLPPPAPR
jgi:hypothetical protein